MPIYIALRDMRFDTIVLGETDESVSIEAGQKMRPFPEHELDRVVARSLAAYRRNQERLGNRIVVASVCGRPRFLKLGVDVRKA